MSRHAIQLLAALSNPASRERFAQLVLAEEVGLPSLPKVDRLLLGARCARETNGQTVLEPAGIRAALDEVRAAKDRTTEKRRIEFLPRREQERKATLESLAHQVFPDDEEVRETALNERLAEAVVDVALVRRALVDHGIVGRDPVTQTYWRTRAAR